MNGTMVRNDITISLISCQFETSTVLILERLFVFIIETELNLKRKTFHLLHIILLVCIWERRFLNRSKQTNSRAFLIVGLLQAFDTKANNVEADVSNKNSLKWTQFYS